MSYLPPLVAELDRRLQAAAPADQAPLALELAWLCRVDDPERALRLAEVARGRPGLEVGSAIALAAAQRRLDSSSVSGPPGEIPDDPYWRVRWVVLKATCDLLDSSADRPELRRLLLEVLELHHVIELNPRDHAHVLNQIGRSLYQERKPTDALPWFQGAQEMSAAIFDRRGEAAALVNVGNILDDLGDPTGALDAYARSLELQEGLASEFQLGLAYFNIAEVRHRMGETGEARRYARQAVEFWRSEGHAPVRVNALALLARVAIAHEDLEVALSTVARGQELATRLGDAGWQGVFRGYAAMALVHHGLLERAAEALGERPPTTTQSWLVHEYDMGAAALFSARGEHDAVVELIERGGGRGPDWFNGAHEHMLDLFTDSYRALGRHDAAFDLVRDRLRYLEQRTRVLAETRAITRAREVDVSSARQLASRARDEEAALRQQLQQAQRLEAVGQLASGVAHDFNNLLTVILGEADSIAMSTSAADDVLRSAETICSAAERAGGLTRQLLAFARKAPMRAGPVDVCQVVSGLGPMIDAATGRHVEVVLDVPSGPLPPVHGDPALLEQVVLNLALNAKDAMPGGGTLTICAQARGDNAADIVVADTGTGIPAAVMERVFEPFYTTKGPDRGSGLGLAMVWGVVQQLGGTVRVESQVGQGTRFTVELAAADAAV